MNIVAPSPRRCALTIHPVYQAKLARTLALFETLPEHEQEMVILIMHNWIIGGDHAERLYGVNRILLAHERLTTGDPHLIDEDLPAVRVRILGAIVQEMERA